MVLPIYPSTYLFIFAIFGLIVVEADTQISTKVAFRGSRHAKPIEGRHKCQNSQDDFPIPPTSLPNLVEKARVFAQTYFTDSELVELRSRLDEARRIGADRLKIRQVVQGFVNEVLDEERKIRIASKKNELNREFGNTAEFA